MKRHRKRPGSPPVQPPQKVQKPRRLGWVVGLIVVVGVLALAYGLRGRWLPSRSHDAAGMSAGSTSRREGHPESGTSGGRPWPGKGPGTGARGAAGDSDNLAREASELLNKGEAGKAVPLLEQALALSPNSEDIHYNLGIAYGKVGNITNAESHYRAALKILPDYPEVHNNLGNLLMREKRLDEAAQHFTEAIKILPDYASAHNNLGIVYQQQGRLQEALACFEKAVRYDTNYWQAYFNLAHANFGLNHLDEGVAALRETVRLNPSFERAQQELAEALATPNPPKRTP